MPTILRIGNINTHIEGDFPRSVVDLALSYMSKGFFMSPKYRMCQHCDLPIPQKLGKCTRCGRPRQWDGRIRFLKGGKKGIPYFPTGLLSTVATVMQHLGYKPSFVDERAKPSNPDVALPEEAFNVKLIGRDLWVEQQEAIYAALNYTRGVIQSPTASGKSTIIAGLVKLIQHPGLIFIHNTTIATQLRKEIQELTGEPIGLIKQDVLDIQRVTVVMTQSLYGQLSLDKESREKNIPPLQVALDLVKLARFVILDEAHHTSSKTWYTLVNQLVNAYYRIGVTGTAFMRPSGDDMVLVGATGGLIYEASEASMIEQGKIAKPIIHLYKIDKPDNIDKLEYKEAYKEGVVQNYTLNKLAAKITVDAYNQNKQILVLVEHIAHLDNFSAFLPKEIKYEILKGETNEEDRETAKNKFEKGELRLIIASSIFNEGISLNGINLVIRLGLGKSNCRIKQQVGRGQRTGKNKTTVDIVDFIYNTNKYLQEHSFETYAFYQKLGYETIMEQS